ncbi:MAG: hypothetical protein ACYTAS_00980 [Planctomycetota bacterium]|jgi:hypothetical protein
MKVFTTLLVLGLLSLAGCALGPSHYWYHPDRSLEQAKEDFNQCKRRAQQESGEAAASRSSSGDERLSDNRIDASSSPSGAYRKNVLSGCMQGKGYLRVRDYRLPSGVRTKDYTTEGVAGW